MMKVMFLCMDRGDEYQLVAFIVGYAIISPFSQSLCHDHVHLLHQVHSKTWRQRST